MRYSILALMLSAGLCMGQIPTPRQEVLEAERARPTDPWPRGQGHVVLALPGSPEAQKAYDEPGGSFSPEFKSFGVSLWIIDHDGMIQQTSDSIPLSQIRQRLVWRPDAVPPSIRTEAAEYVAEWSLGSKPGTSELTVHPRLAPDHRLVLAIRSVGPAGAPIQSLDWANGELRVNGRFIIHSAPPPRAVYVGSENLPGWTMASGSATCRELNGWCFARLELSGNDAAMTITDSFPRPVHALSTPSTRSGLQVDLPDGRFAASLDAQVAHLLMGTVDNQTRPGEPNQYPLAWLRDGAYQVVALAQAGRLEAARELVRYFAENDFFGGFGSEADAPGLSLWAMGEVAAYVHGADFDRFLWPHVCRKAEFILGLQSTKEPIERIIPSPLVPEHRAAPDIYHVAGPSRDGLITGRMDFGNPAFFLTAVSYRGLELAAEIANRLHADTEAQRWGTAAQALKQAWNSAYRPTEESDRTYISGMWPTWIVSDRAAYQQGLDAHWNSVWDAARGDYREFPLWTYFDFAFAHQYLFLNQPEKTWQTLEWFWKHQPSPGLYSWWEGSGEENSFHQWQYVRGWVHPPHVTPHYWAAAECLLMQIAMLTYVDESSAGPAIVVGAGIPSAWCAHPMKVGGVVTKAGKIDWNWDGQAMHVLIHGKRAPVRLGPGFPAGAAVHVTTQD